MALCLLRRMGYPFRSEIKPTIIEAAQGARAAITHSLGNSTATGITGRATQKDVHQEQWAK
jgi:hypothetical protein